MSTTWIHPSLCTFFLTGGQVVIKQNNSPPARCKLARKKIFERPIYCYNFEKLWWGSTDAFLLSLSLQPQTKKKPFIFFMKAISKNSKEKRICCRLRKQSIFFRCWLMKNWDAGKIWFFLNKRQCRSISMGVNTFIYLSFIHTIIFCICNENLTEHFFLR